MPPVRLRAIRRNDRATVRRLVQLYITWNIGARRFWHRLIRRCAVGEVSERRRRHGDRGFFVQHFTRASQRRIAPPSLD